MSSEDIFFHALTSEEVNKIKQLGVKTEYKKGDLVFSDGENADHMYFIESGRVSIFILKFTRQEEICTLGEGDYFGEMAFFNGDKRSASVIALLDTTLISVDKASFLNLFETDQLIADKINQIFAQRNKELTFKETLTGGGICAAGGDFQIGIKGDPSIRESAFSRERHKGVIDTIITELQPRILDLLVNRSAYEIFIHCNSGEVHIRSVFDPLNDQIHPATKLLSLAYIDRHFPKIDYDKKEKIIKDIYSFITNDANFNKLPEQYKDNLTDCFKMWKPVGQSDIENTISKLSVLRKIPDFYLRNITISLINDAIRMQFNCDGTQILSVHGFQKFLADNLMPEEESSELPQE